MSHITSKIAQCTINAKCRLCLSDNLKLALTLTPTPPANAMVSQQNVIVNEQVYPLELALCMSCGHLQLINVIAPEILFENYLYVSSTTNVMRDYLYNQSQNIISNIDLKRGDLVVEFGSNDGYLLSCFMNSGMRVLGIDPAQNITKPLEGSIPTITDYFSSALATKILSENGHPKAICAYNVFAHIADMQDVLQGISILLDEEGTFIFEVGYLVDVYTKTLFDTIYHEHLDYHRVAPLLNAFHLHNLTLIHVERSDIQGGAIIGYVKKGIHPISANVHELINNEHALQLNKLQTFNDWSSSINLKGRELLTLVKGLKKLGYSIAGYGSPAKCTTLMYHFNLDSKLIDFIVEDNPLKQGLYTPGMHIPVMSSEELFNKFPDYTIILAWNFTELIIKNNMEYLNKGGKFIIPLPDLRIVSISSYG